VRFLGTKLAKPEAKPAKQLTKHTIAYPWLLSSQPQRKQPPSFFGSIKNRHLLTAGIARIQTHLQEPAYLFPEDFYSDAAFTLNGLFKTLNSLSDNTRVDSLQPYMLRGLLDYIIPANQDIQQRGGSIQYMFPKLNDVDQYYDINDAPFHKYIQLQNINFTYGPYPAPQGYIAQAWYSIVTLVIPQEQAAFKSYNAQKDILKIAMDQGVYIRIDCTVNLPIEFKITNQNGATILKDRRQKFDIQFISPHFGPYDEIFIPVNTTEHTTTPTTPTRKDAAWKLAWKWRVSDMDYLVASNASQADLLLSPRTPQIDWFRHRKEIAKFFTPSKEFEQKYLLGLRDQTTDETMSEFDLKHPGPNTQDTTPTDKNVKK
jgi:hypothetical protein